MVKDGLLEPGDTILSVDPGKTTGVVIAKFVERRTYEIMHAGHVPFRDFDLVFSCVAAANVLVYERFALYEDKAQDQINNEFPSTEMIGWFRALWAAQRKSSDQIYVQPAGERLAVDIPKEHRLVLRNLRHAQDAYRHLRYFIVLHTLRTPLRKVESDDAE